MISLFLPSSPPPPPYHSVWLRESQDFNTLCCLILKTGETMTTTKYKGGQNTLSKMRILSFVLTREKHKNSCFEEINFWSLSKYCNNLQKTKCKQRFITYEILKQSVKTKQQDRCEKLISSQNMNFLFNDCCLLKVCRFTSFFVAVTALEIQTLCKNGA